MKYWVKIKAQVEWDAYFEAEAPDAAKEFAQEAFAGDASVVDMHVALVNSVEAFPLPEPAETPE